MEISACLPAAPGRCSAHHQDELVVPLLLVVVHEAEKMADAHVVCLDIFSRRGLLLAAAFAAHDESVWSVSYTHLTLPTILLV